MKFKEMEIGKENVAVVLLLTITEKSCKNGKTYCDVTFSDGDEIITAKVWNYKKEVLLRGAEENTIVEGYFIPEIYHEAVSYVATRYFVYQGDEYCMDDFVLHAPIDADAFFKHCFEAVDEESIYGKITRAILLENEDIIKQVAAAKGFHHTAKGGLLWHTGQMLLMGENIVPLLPLLNKDLFFAGIILHDIGKVKELSTDFIGETLYTEEGELCGHLYAGAEMVELKAREILSDVEENRREINLLKHIILSHHGRKEFGSPEEPKIIEAMVLHHLDMIDSRYNMFELEYDKLNIGEFSDRKPALGNVHILKHD
ncbi:MAG: HD domain-containing protein [Eubacteriales bacterium]|nr:HD domain-containing protein [Eubacteriales bacterium]